MNLDDINKWLTLGANVGVLIGIVFLSLEIQQSNRIAIASAETEIRNNLSASNESVYGDTEIAELLYNSQDSSHEYTGIEQIKVGAWIRRRMNAWLAIETSYDSGLITEETYNVILDDVRSAISAYPAMLPNWRNVADTYPAFEGTATFRAISQTLDQLE